MFFAVPGAFADALIRAGTNRNRFTPTPSARLDNDLLIVNDPSRPPWAGHVAKRTHPRRARRAMRALVEIWQCDACIYLHSGCNDQSATRTWGFGRFLTGSTGEYLFHNQTGRIRAARHTFTARWRNGKELLTTQCYIKGQPK